MTITQNIAVKGQHNKPIVTDLFFKQNTDKKPVVIFCHGYKGFKDWGAWNIMAEAFANAGLFFVKFNFSHNGGTLEQPIDFPDLEAFGNNTYTKELDDLEIDREDDFDKMYKGEISRSGAAILPSKRVRRIPEKIIKNTGYQVIEMAQFKPGANYVIFKKPGKQNPAVYKIDEIIID